MFYRIATATLLVALLATVTAAADDGFVSLFDGKTLKGWTQYNGKATYKVEDGAIVGTTEKGSPNSFLCTDQAYDDFELIFDVKVDSSLNSGVQIRSCSSKDYNKGRVHGPQVEIEKSPGESAYIYGEACGGWISKKATHKLMKNDDWNTVRVIAKGPRIQTWINGEAVEDLTNDQMSKVGFIGLQVHGVGNNGPFQVRWKNLKIKDLSPATAKSRQGKQFKPAPQVKSKPKPKKDKK